MNPLPIPDGEPLAADPGMCPTWWGAELDASQYWRWVLAGLKGCTWLAVGAAGAQMGTSSPSPSFTGPAPRPQGQVCLAGLAGHLRGQLDGICTLILLRALPRARLPGGDRKSAWAPGPDPCGSLEMWQEVGLRWGSRGLGGQGKEMEKLAAACARVDLNVETWIDLQGD